MTPNRNTLFMQQEAYDALKARFPRLNEPWTADEIAVLTQMNGIDIPVDEIAEQLGRTPNSIRLKLRSLGLLQVKPASRPWTEHEEKTIVEMYNSGISFEEMSDKTGRSIKAIISRLVRLRLKLFPAE